MYKCLKLIAANAFWIVLLIILYVAMQAIWNPENSMSYNKTIGVAFDMRNILWRIIIWIPFCIESLPIYAIGYGIIYFTKRVMNVRLTIIHLTLLIACIETYHIQNFYCLKLISIIIWVIFLIALITSKIHNDIHSKQSVLPDGIK